MTFIPDPITLVNLVFCIIIVLLSLWWYKKTGSYTPLYIGLAFGLFGISHLATLFDLTTPYQPILIIIRTSAYILVALGLFFIATDAIQRVIAERALHASEHRYRTLYEDNPSMYFTVDAAGIVLSVNEFGCRQLGYTDTELVGEPVLNVFYEVDKEAALQNVRQCLEHAGQVFHWELRKVRKDKSMLWVHETARAVPGTNGDPVVFIVCEDISERKRAEAELARRTDELSAAYEELTATDEELRANYDELSKTDRELRESEERFRALYEENPSMYFTLDSEGTVLSVNQFGAAQLGYSVAELVGRSVLEVFYPDDRTSVQENLRRCLEHPGKPAYWEFRKVRKDGAIIWVKETVRTMQRADGRIIVLVVCEDITEQKMVKVALDRLTEKLNLLNAITLTDIRNAAFSLSGYFELEKKVSMDNKLQQYIHRQTQILATITDSLKFADYYQNLGLMPPRWQYVKPTLLFGISHLDCSSLSRAISVGDLEIFADPLLENVFLSLAENVVLHGGDATQISVWYQETPRGLTLFFEDNGPGIPEGHKEKIFERRSPGKKGMGLFLTREILGITGITIRETGTPGTGARFEILVPPGAYRFT
jgi:PAS domain S-box-containing protein